MVSANKLMQMCLFVHHFLDTCLLKLCMIMILYLNLNIIQTNVAVFQFFQKCRFASTERFGDRQIKLVPVKWGSWRM